MFFHKLTRSTILVQTMSSFLRTEVSLPEPLYDRGSKIDQLVTGRNIELERERMTTVSPFVAFQWWRVAELNSRREGESTKQIDIIM